MAILSERAKEALRRAVTDDESADEIRAALESSTGSQALNVADIGVTADIGTTDGSGGAGDAALAADVEARLDTIEGKVDAIIDALVAAGLMAA